MTLITYPTRVHFADDVLEEALHSELEQGGYAAALLIMPHAPAHLELEDRVCAGLPAGLETSVVSCTEQSDLSMIAQQVSLSRFDPDVIIAFGASRAIELGRKCRYKLSQKLQKRLPLFAVPGVDGLPAPCGEKIQSWHAGLPSVLICDPTVALNADEAQNRRAWLLSLVRCCESYLASSYNPPADGMALDALDRCVNISSKVGQIHGVDLQRELMAAGLNAALSQEKGVGPATVISRVLVDAVPGLNTADVAGVVLPPLLAARRIPPERANALSKVLGHRDDLSLDQAILKILGVTDPSFGLSALGVPESALDPAAYAAAAIGCIDFEQARQALDCVY